MDNNLIMQFLIDNPWITCLLFPMIVLLALITKRLVIGLGVIILLLAATILPGGIMLIFGAVIIVLVLILTRRGGGDSIQIKIEGDGNTVTGIIDKSRGNDA